MTGFKPLSSGVSSSTNCTTTTTKEVLTYKILEWVARPSQNDFILKNSLIIKFKNIVKVSITNILHSIQLGKSDRSKMRTDPTTITNQFSLQLSLSNFAISTPASPCRSSKSRSSESPPFGGIQSVRSKKIGKFKATAHATFLRTKPKLPLGPFIITELPHYNYFDCSPPL